jgi:hypothetical protein
VGFIETYTSEDLMIETLEDLINRAPETGPKLSIGAGPDEFYLIGPDEFYLLNGLQSGSERVSPDLVQRLRELGIFYLYAGNLEFNSMAMRLLQDMREGGAPLEEKGFRFRVEESKRLYQIEHLSDWNELQMGFSA